MRKFTEMLSQKTVYIPLIAVVVALAAAGGWYYMDNISNENASADSVAVVNGQTLTQTDLDTIQEQIAQRQGFEIASLEAEGLAAFEQDSIDALISQTLLEQAVEDSGVKPSDEEISTRMEEIRQQFPTEEEYNAALETEGLTEDSLRIEVTKDMTTQSFLNQELDLESIEISDEEIQSTYDSAKAQNPEATDFPELSDEIRAQIRTSLLQEAQQKEISDFMEGLRDKGDVEVLI